MWCIHGHGHSSGGNAQRNAQRKRIYSTSRLRSDSECSRRVGEVTCMALGGLELTSYMCGARPVVHGRCCMAVRAHVQVSTVPHRSATDSERAGEFPPCLRRRWPMARGARFGKTHAHTRAPALFGRHARSLDRIAAGPQAGAASWPSHRALGGGACVCECPRIQWPVLLRMRAALGVAC